MLVCASRGERKGEEEDEKNRHKRRKLEADRHREEIKKDRDRVLKKKKKRENEINWTCECIKHGFCPLQGTSSQDTITQTGAQGCL